MPVPGPVTVQAIPVPTVEDPATAPVPSFEQGEAHARASDTASDHLTTILNLLKRSGGVIFPGKIHHAHGLGKVLVIAHRDKNPRYREAAALAARIQARRM